MLQYYFFKSYDSPVASKNAAVTVFYNPDEPDPEYICQRNQILEQ